MKNNISNIKTFQIMSNGSLNVSYQTTIYKSFFFVEKDFVNFIFNLKNKSVKQNSDNSGVKYKNKYVSLET